MHLNAHVPFDGVFMQLVVAPLIFAIGGFVPSAAIAGVLVLIGLAGFFYLGLKGPTDY